MAASRGRSGLGVAPRHIVERHHRNLAGVAGLADLFSSKLVTWHLALVLDQLRELRVEPAAALLEPVGRNTAPAVTLAALAALEGGADPVLVVTPADQTVTDEAAFTDALQRAVRVAAGGAIAILGITPDRPETGYGYIRVTADNGAGAGAADLFCFTSVAARPAETTPRTEMPTSITRVA